MKARGDMADAPISGHQDRMVTPGSSSPPPLSLLCVFGALVSLLINRVIVPGFAEQTSANQWLKVERWGDFFALVSAISGCVALPYAVLPLVRANRSRLARTLPVAGLTAVLLYVILRAALCERVYTSAQEVLLGIGAAHVLVISVAVRAFPHCRKKWIRVALASTAVMAAAGLAGHLTDVLARVHGIGWQPPLGRAIDGVGELGYLATLVAVAFAINRPPRDPHFRVIYFSMFLLLGMLGTSYILIARSLGSAFGLILYSAQRVRLWVDMAPMVYGAPICLGLAAGLAGLLAKDSHRRQWAIGLLLLVAGGYGPASPLRSLSVALAAAMFARAWPAGDASAVAQHSIPGPTATRNKQGQPDRPY